jgi:hypothetical protein
MPFDVALLRLEADLGVVPMAFATREPDAGAALEHVGYGTADEGDMSGWGTQRTVTHPLVRIDRDFLWSGDATANTCSGDSGGPALFGGEVAAVISDGPDCHSLSADVRVDEAQAFIESTLMAWEPRVEAEVTPTQQHGCSSAEGALGPAALLLMGTLTLGKTRRR